MCIGIFYEVQIGFLLRRRPEESFYRGTQTEVTAAPAARQGEELRACSPQQRIPHTCCMLVCRCNTGAAAANHSVFQSQRMQIQLYYRVARFQKKLGSHMFALTLQTNWQKKVLSFEISDDPYLSEIFLAIIV